MNARSAINARSGFGTWHLGPVMPLVPEVPHPPVGGVAFGTWHRPTADASAQASRLLSPVLRKTESDDRLLSAMTRDASD